MDNDLPDDAVEMVRAIRTRHYEETKHMTIEERRAHDKNDYDAFKALLANAKENYMKISIVSPEHFTKGDSYGQ